MALLGGCASETDPGPHAPDCLVSLWLDAGCSLEGTSSPTNPIRETIAWWNEHTVGEVQKEMEDLYELAIQGTSGYEDECFGK